MSVRKSLILFCLILYCSQSLNAQSGHFTLDEVLTALGHGAEFLWDPFFQSGVFSTDEYYASFQVKERDETSITIINGNEIFSSPSAFIENGQLFFPEPFVASLKRVSQNNIEEEHFFRIAAIVIDAGHGGRDSGAVGDHTVSGKPLRLLEKDVTLKVAQDLYGRLVREFPEKQILLTRNTDIFISLNDRVEQANAIPLSENEAVIFISVHTNASFNKTVRGYEVWYLKSDYERSVLDSSKYEDSKELIPILEDMMQEEFITESIIIAKSILDQFDEMLGNTLPSRGIKEGEWFVVKNSRMPAVLVELGFITNQTDALLLADNAYLKKFAEALYKGIRNFINEFEGSGGYTIVE